MPIFEGHSGLILLHRILVGALLGCVGTDDLGVLQLFVLRKGPVGLAVGHFGTGELHRPRGSSAQRVEQVLVRLHGSAYDRIRTHGFDLVLVGILLQRGAVA